MYRHLTLCVAALLIFACCQPFRHVKKEIHKIRKEAEQLHEDARTFMHEAVTISAGIGMNAVAAVKNTSGKIDKRAIRFAAITVGTTLADDALKTIAMHKAHRFDRIFGVNRSEAVISMILSTYGYPIVNDIIVAYVDYFLETEGTASGSGTVLPSIDSVVASRIAQFSLDDAVRMVLGFGNSKHTPEYFRSIALTTVNSDRYCATRNWKDNGIIYQYRISEDGVDYRSGDSAWTPMNNIPFIGKAVSIASDNNRLLVLTDQHELWWYCVKDDQAAWSIDIMKTAVEFMALKPLVTGELCEVMLPLMAKSADSIAQISSSIKYLDKWKKLAGSERGSLDYWKKKCAFWSDVVLSIDRVLLKTDSSASFTAQDYAGWSANAHRAGTWSNLLSWKSDTIVFNRARNVPKEKITDIAIGNWNGTVVTAYVVAEGKIWFLDEEIIQPEWKPIEKWNDKWAILGEKAYQEHTGRPYPLDSLSKIDACNSVVAVLKNTGESPAVHWIRWDYHQKDDFVYWPLDWCEHGWKTIHCPPNTKPEFRISTLENIDPREERTVWSIPAPAFTFHNYLPQEGYQGIFGDVPREKVSAYPVNIWINANDTVLTFAAKKSEKVDRKDVAWKKEAD